ncbi:hypothetical protein [Dokdonella koreensis]|uniref:Peptidase S8 and S53 subtilisin kexin sedolisin n=1 Tax=Dokdonella koreensis DS-123 TaxID=1300342 RepID=A0A160DTD7_9GAMM|nr:hypothetical protein [Dokdonella koreensis]ANB16843.1 Peptidase S8 and S53 subtilisin kexin sedolisin [Dokdonella koreensis DS-123]
MTLRTPSRRAASGPSSLPVLALLIALPGAVPAAPAGTGLTLTVGLTPHGDSSTCGSASHAQVNVGDVVDFCYTVTNTSPTPLAYSTLEDSASGRLLDHAALALAPGASQVHHHRIVARTSATHTVTWTAQDDLIRYAYDDTQPLDFVDVRSTGTAFDMNAWGGEREIVLPFAFPFYGVASDRLCVSNGGFIKALGSRCDGQILFIDDNSPLQTGRAPFDANGFITPFWDLLNNIQGGVWWQVRGQAPDRRLVVQWDRGHVFWGVNWTSTGETPGRLSAQAVLGEDGSIAFQYQNTIFGHELLGNYDPEGWDNGGSATIGLTADRRFGAAASPYSYNTPMPRPAPSSIRWTRGGAATVLAASATVTLDVGGPVIAASPVTVAATAPLGSGAPVTATLTIGNAGDRTLDWSLVEGDSATGYRPPPIAAPAARPIAERLAEYRRQHDTLAAEAAARPPVAVPPTAVTGAAGCGPEVPGLIIHDDDSAEDAFGSNSTSTTLLDKFTPTFYPATFTTVCTALTRDGSPTAQFAYEVAVFDDNGPDGGPGDLLGTVAATASTPTYPNYAFNRADLSSLGITLDSGSVYIGVRLPAGGYASLDRSASDALSRNEPEASYYRVADGSFFPLVTNSGPIRSLLVRAEQTAPGCTNLADVPWLSLAATSGSIAAGASPTTIDLTLDPTGLAEGVHTANLCIASGYESVAVPVALAVGNFVPAAALDTAPVDLTLEIGTSGSRTLTLANAGQPGSLLHYRLTETAGSCDAPGDVAWLRAAPLQGQIAAGASAALTLDVDTAGLALGDHAASLCIATSDPDQPRITVPIALSIRVVDALFGDGFDIEHHPPGIYTSREAFLPHVQTGYYEEGFTGVPANQEIFAPLTFSGAGFSYSIYTQSGAHAGLYNFPGVISHNNSADQIVITFTTPVTAVGGYFWESNGYGDGSGGPIWLSLSDGSFVALGNTNQALSFRGFTSRVPITSLIVDSPNSNSAWAKLDNLIVGRKR